MAGKGKYTSSTVGNENIGSFAESPSGVNHIIYKNAIDDGFLVHSKRVIAIDAIEQRQGGV